MTVLLISFPNIIGLQFLQKADDLIIFFFQFNFFICQAVFMNKITAGVTELKNNSQTTLLKYLVRW